MTDKTMKKRRLAPAASLALLLLGGCSFIPEYIRPASPVSEAWPTGPAYPARARAAGQRRSRTGGFGMGGVLPLTPAPQPDRSGSGEQPRPAGRGAERPAGPGAVSHPAGRPAAVGGYRRQPSAPADAGRPVAHRQASIASQYDVSVGTTSYELDLFGRVRSLEQSALESYFATDQARIATQISLIAEVANAYLTLLADKELLKLTEDTLRTQRQSYDLTSRSFDRGVGTQLDVAQARTAVETARANRAAYVRQIAQDKNALNLLVGAPVADQVLDKAPSLGKGDFVANLPVGLPSGLLQRRPDIMQAEYNLRAANANIGAARAAFFPTISLTASAGTASASLSGLFEGGSGAWAFAPQINLPIFDFGRREANLESAKVEREIGVAQYEKSIQTAFREVSDALAAQGTLDEQLEAQSSLVDATRSSYDLSILRYNRGLDSFLNALDSQRSLYAAQQDLINARLSQLSNLVTLYKVLGGGAPKTTVAGL